MVTLRKGSGSCRCRPTIPFRPMGHRGFGHCSATGELRSSSGSESRGHFKFLSNRGHGGKGSLRFRPREMTNRISSTETPPVCAAFFNGVKFGAGFYSSSTCESILRSPSTLSLGVANAVRVGTCHGRLAVAHTWHPAPAGGACHIPWSTSLHVTGSNLGSEVNRLPSLPGLNTASSTMSTFGNDDTKRIADRITAADAAASELRVLPAVSETQFLLSRF